MRGKEFTVLGAVKLDHDVRAIQSYFTERGAPRSAFARLADLGELLAVESRAELRARVRGARVRLRYRAGRGPERCGRAPSRSSRRRLHRRS